MVFDPREFDAIIENGAIRTDSPLNLPERTRLRIIIKSKAPSAESRQRALQRLREIGERGLFKSGGKRYTRDELHERD